nr:substrate-binding domain-containing protein [uncultured Duganella sp.]
MIFRLFKTMLIAACGAIAIAGAARADDIKVLTTGIMKGSFARIAAQFERETGHTLTMSWGPSSGNSPEASQVRIKAGEQVDVLIMVDKGMDELVRGGYFVPLSRRDVAVSKIGVAVKAGQPLPDIGTVAAVRQTLLAAKSIGYSEGASGSHIANVMLKQLGIADQVAAKSKVILGRKFVGEALAAGEVELGLQQLSELRLEPGVSVVGPLPDALQKASVVSAAVSSRARNVEAATRFVAFLSSPYAAEAISDSGLELPAP